MKVRITFPDGKSYTYDVKLKRGMTIDDIVDQILDQMLEAYSKTHTVKDPEAWKEAHRRWLLAHIYEALLEQIFG